MKKSEAQAILMTTALNLLISEVGYEAAMKYNIVLGRYEAMTRSGDTAEKIENDEGWTVLAILTTGLEMPCGTIQCNGARVIDTYAHGRGYAVLGNAGSVVAAIWQYCAN